MRFGSFEKLETCDDEQNADMDISFEHPQPANYTSIGSIQLEKVLAKKPSLSLQTEEELSAMTEIAKSVATKLGHFDEFDESESSDEARASIIK
ncbi:Oidioi.mRNA.OKI2018_I69.chr1.g2075.t1.cds [Oikopleura dioica]|uniref:Oidioi.mRNA.OKI2018_I69.chr1.g2075.t1.cds n=1 Tax=Oikopleura dioica TaxID=34765 RepID=A0ABN7SU64_OIKDI|nr:Oidioi.mRNA.OKI2018_I69.chr1.g2075.t1.cds [Oikopleura dioica]